LALIIKEDQQIGRFEINLYNSHGIPRETVPSCVLL